MKQGRFLFTWLLGTAAVATAAARYAVWQQETSRKESPAAHAQHMDSEAIFHQWMHAHLDLSADQHASLTTLEETFETRRQAMRQQITEANAALAEAIRQPSASTETLQPVLAKLASAQSELQRATLDHFFAMKQSLTAKQQQQLVNWTHDSLLGNPRN